jgi:multidrug resistance efflux pump
MKPLFLLLFTLPLLAGSYKARIEPLESVTIAAEVSGKVVELNQSDELKTLNKKVLVIDHALESQELANSRKKLQFLQEQIRIKQGQYNRIKHLKGQSLFTKERYQSELLALRMQKYDLQNQIAKLKDTIRKKEIYLHNRYLKKLYVRKGAFVAPGAKLMDVEDLSGSRIVIYVDAKDLQKVKRGSILIDGQNAHGYTLQKAAKTTDDHYISSYRIELVKNGDAPFGKIVTVEVGE